MNNSKKSNSEYLSKIILIIIVVIINIIAIMAVIITVGRSIKSLKSDIDSGKISKGSFQTSEYGNEMEEGNEIATYDTEDGMEEDSELGIDVKSLLKVAMLDSNVRKSLILMVCALILLAVAIYILVKLQ